MAVYVPAYRPIKASLDDKLRNRYRTQAARVLHRTCLRLLAELGRLEAPQELRTELRCLAMDWFCDQIRDAEAA